MIVIHGKQRHGRHRTYGEMTAPTPPAVERICDCHGEPMRFASASDSRPARWECRVRLRYYATLRGIRKRRTTDGHSRAEVFALGGGRCYLCGVELDPGRWEEDHVIPLALGGKDILENCRPACVDCNRAKGSRVYVLDHMLETPPSAR